MEPSGLDEIWYDSDLFTKCFFLLKLKGFWLFPRKEIYIHFIEKDAIEGTTNNTICSYSGMFFKSLKLFH